MADAERAEGEGFRAVARSVVGRDALDTDAEALELGDGSIKAEDGAFLALVRQQIDACDARVIIDGDVSELVAGTVATLVASFSAVDAEAGFSEFAELF